MKKLYKSESDKILGGVCAGIAEYFALDPTLIRVGYTLLTVFTGIIPGVVAYVVLSVIIPRKSEVKK